MIKLNKIFYFGLLFCIFLLISSSVGVKITSVDIPPYHAITESPPEPLILNCNYELPHDKHNASPVLKWKRNSKLIYQWMINKLKPQAFDAFKYAVDLKYEASDDPYKIHSSLAITNPTWNMSGLYECSVSFRTDMAAVSGNLSIIDVRNYTLKITQTEMDDDIEVMCNAENVYPKPDLKLRLNETSSVYIKRQEHSIDDDGFYDAFVVGVLKNDGSMDNLSCIMSFPDTNYVVVQSNLGENNSNRLNSVTFLIPTMVILILFFFNK